MIAGVSFICCLALFTLIGVASSVVRKNHVDDYLLAGRSVPGWLSALSAVATNNSGFMFVGLLGFAYTSGLGAAWLQLGWVIGDAVVWHRLYARVRQRSGELGIRSVPALLGTRDDGSVDRPIVMGASLLTLVFLGVYAAAQLDAGSVALSGIFGVPPWAGATLGALIVVAYCVSGGLRASIWTDAAQAIVMLVAMLALVGAAASEVGGPGALYGALASIDPALVKVMPTDGFMAFSLLVLGYLGGGLAVAGQPHILVRAMAIRGASEIPRARRIYFAWYVPFSVLSVAAGLYARVLLPDLGAHGGVTGSAAEMALPELSRLLLPEALLGLVLAGLFSASLSTADSQILACSAAITEDIAPGLRGSAGAAKRATLSIGLLALLIALAADEGVFTLVLVAWSGLGATLGPPLLLRLYGRPLSGLVASWMMGAALVTVIGWKALGLGSVVYEVLPGMAVAFLVYFAAPALGLVAEPTASSPSDDPV